jgi:medium-chain acyl-[acyl-carrier-protein] hydrolase
MMPNQPIWIENTHVKTYETDSLNRWKPSAFFQTMEEVATHHAASFGFTFKNMFEDKMVWILSRVKVQFDRFPLVNDEVTVQSWSRGVQQKLFFGRDFHFSDQSGELFARASTLWVLFNPETRRIVFPQTLKGEYPSIPDKKVFDDPLDKINSPERFEDRLKIMAGYSSIDMMGHVNNARYIDWICDCFQQELFNGSALQQIQINYVNEVKPGEELTLARGSYKDKNNTWAVQGINLTTQVKAFEAQLILTVL